MVRRTSSAEAPRHRPRRDVSAERVHGATFPSKYQHWLNGNGLLVVRARFSKAARVRIIAPSAPTLVLTLRKFAAQVVHTGRNVSIIIFYYTFLLAASACRICGPAAACPVAVPAHRRLAAVAVPRENRARSPLAKAW